jgi:hypothetical protein
MLQTHFKLAGPKKKNSKKFKKRKFAGPIRLKHVTLFGCRVRGETRVTSLRVTNRAPVRGGDVLGGD